MAQKRMIDKKISVSEQVANLGTDGALLFTWMVVHADDCGVLPYSPRTIKALVVPMLDCFTVESVGIHLESMRNQGLIEEFNFHGEKYWKLPTFFKTQTFKKDRQPSIMFSLKLGENIKDNWKLCEQVMDSNWNPNGTETDPEIKESKEIKEEKLKSVGECEGKVSAEDGGGIEQLRKKVESLRTLKA